jgi:YidC/Oxa1 family membrane protein insertase
MDNQRSKSEQMMLVMMLVFGATLLYQHFFAPAKKPAGPVRPVPTLSKAFAGIDPGSGSPLVETAARAEVAKLQQQINSDGQDGYSYWARLRMGLIQQYILHNLEKKSKQSGLFGMGAKVQYFPPYDEIIMHGASDAIDAQAIYQQGDLLWRESTTTGDHKPSQEAATNLEQLIHKGRGAAPFLDNEIYVPRQIDPKAPLFALPAGFELKKVRDVHRTQGNPNPPGILERVDEYYSTNFFHKLFGTVVAWFGNNPKYSYGLTILLFALCTRLMVQPLNKKQYESMKGMALIAPEMKKIQEKYKDKSDQQAQMQMIKEVRALQQRHGVNPMMGCGLAVVQMPIFFLVVLPFIQHNEPKLEMVGASFGWIQSLAHPDIPLLVIYGISMLLSFRLSTTPPADDAQRQQQAIMSFIFPVMLPFFMKNYS